jgi:hypothetical protein
VSNRCTITVVAQNRAIHVENICQTTSIAACICQCVGWPLNPLISLHNVSTPPAADDDKIGLTEVNQNNPSGNAVELDNTRVVFYNALTALPALGNSVKNDDYDDASSKLLASWLMGAMWRR